MKQLPLESPHFKYLLESYRQWLELLGYAESTVNSLPVHVRELLHYIESNHHIRHITQVKPRHIYAFTRYLQTRHNRKYGGSLSASHINKSIQSVNSFARYVSQSGKHILDATPRRIENQVQERTVLTTEEIRSLYDASFTQHRQNSTAIGQRDRAIIAVFYGCGLRKNEGAKLNISDIDTVKGLVFVRKGKGGKQRYVPIAGKHLDDIKAYLEEGRNWYLQNNAGSAFYYRHGEPRPKKQNTDDAAFFLTMKGKRMQSFESRFKHLKEQAGIEKQFSTHSLRHSIATHLLQSGMPMEEIAKFLGHSSLESTQIYTHIVNHLNKQEKDAVP